MCIDLFQRPLPYVTTHLFFINDTTFCFVSGSKFVPPHTFYFYFYTSFNTSFNTTKQIVFFLILLLFSMRAQPFLITRKFDVVFRDLYYTLVFSLHRLYFPFYCFMCVRENLSFFISAGSQISSFACCERTEMRKTRNYIIVKQNLIFLL